MSTVILYDDHLYSDTQATKPDGSTFKVSKIFTHGNSIFGGVGTVEGLEQFKQWNLAGRPSTLWSFLTFKQVEFSELTAIEYDGSNVYIWTSMYNGFGYNFWDCVTIKKKKRKDYYCLGSGSKFAFHYLNENVCHPIEAMIHASLNDEYTNSSFQVLKYGDKVPFDYEVD